MTRKIPFTGQIWKQSNSYVVTIPMDYVANGLVPENTELKFVVEVPE